MTTLHTNIPHYHPPHEWTEPGRPITSSRPYNPDPVDTVVHHWTGVNNVPPNPTPNDIANILRNTQRYYLDHRGYSLGYNVATDPNGHAWGIRETTYRAAATRGHNHHTFAVLHICNTTDTQLTPAAIHTTNTLLRNLNTIHNRTLTQTPHHQLGPTTCPGPYITRNLKDGTLTPKEHPIMSLTPIPPHVVFDSRNPTNSVIRDHTAVPIHLPNTGGGALITIANIPTRTHATKGHIRIGRNASELNASPGWAHTQPGRPTTDTLAHPIDNDTIWIQPRHTLNNDGTPVGTDIQIIITATTNGTPLT